ncbi:MAG TPA: 2-amino-4-hydroxy-6-hydroxymethyldihydropteridine diphosphokinase [Thermoanaerobaculia bacterium]|nr:2-amino-4-hydroxy-6-hydroxymethyldihydropteridine diphosphokinase [Thermoanaerobaculia bacterium]
MKKSSRKNRRSSSRTGTATRKSSDSRPGATAYLGLGSNLGDRKANLIAALWEIGRRAPLVAVSSFYRSEPEGYSGQPEFWNAAAEISWRGSPEDLLRAAKQIERRLGRSKTFPGGPREIDVDILDLGGLVREAPDPVLPHPRLASRRFALAPLAEIAPAWRHPVTGRRAKEMMAALPSRPWVERILERRADG